MESRYAKSTEKNIVKEFVWADDLDMKDLAKVIDKKNARFYIVTLDKNDDGIFKGIEIHGWTIFE